MVKLDRPAWMDMITYECADHLLCAHFLSVFAQTGSCGATIEGASRQVQTRLIFPREKMTIVNETG